MRKLARLLAVLLFGFIVLVTPMSYAAPMENASPEITIPDAIEYSENGSPLSGINYMVNVTHHLLPDGGSSTDITIDPSWRGAIKGAEAGGAVGTTVCVATGVGAPVAVACGAIGGVIGGAIGFVFGPV